MRRSLTLAAVALFLFVMGFRWALVDRFGRSLPELDQWDAEARQILEPWYSGDHSLSNLFHAHNEHRIVPTRLVALGLTIANRQWDQRLEAVVNACIPAAIAVCFLLLASRNLSRRSTAVNGLLLAIAFSGLFSWENAIHGFHSQQWYLILFALGALCWLPFRRPKQATWWLGLAAAALSLVAMGSGPMAAFACAAVVLVQAWRERSISWVAAVTVLLCAALFALGVHIRVVVAGHYFLQAHSFATFWWAAMRGLGWPVFEAGWGYTALLFWVPWAVVAVRILRRRPATQFNLLLFVLGLWVLMQVAAMAYARGGSAPPPAPRYIDTFFLGLITNALCLAVLVDGGLHSVAGGGDPGSPAFDTAGAGVNAPGYSDPAGDHGTVGKRRLWLLLAGAWTLLLVIGLCYQLRDVVPGQLKDLPRFYGYAESNTRFFLASGDEAFLRHPEIPYPDAASLAEVLRMPPIRRLLPASVRLPLALTTAATTGFADADTRGPQNQPPYPKENDGLSPNTAPLDEARFHGSYGAEPAVWRSQPVSSPVRGWLQFLVAGDLGRTGLSLTLSDPTTGRVLATVKPDHVPGEGWHNAFVRAPSGPFVVEARVDRPNAWFAFADPVEMGRWSHAAWRATRWAGTITLAAGLIFLVALMAEAWSSSEDLPRTITSVANCNTGISRAPRSK
jgi:hypothetical protein